MIVEGAISFILNITKIIIIAYFLHKPVSLQWTISHDQFQVNDNTGIHSVNIRIMYLYSQCGVQVVPPGTSHIQ
jgi:hypothetical protein